MSTARPEDAAAPTSRRARRVDLAVIGASFAGLRAAREAARRGHRVTVFERKRTIGEPVRTSGGSWIAAMRDLGIPTEYYHPVRVAKFFSQRRAASLAYPDPPGCILHVDRLTRFLAAEAEAAGAEVIAGARVRGVLGDEAGVTGLHTDRGEYRCRQLIDASGVAAFLPRAFGYGPFRRFGLGSEALLDAPGWPEDEVAFWLGPPVAPAGYGWAFPEGQGRVRLGVGILKPDHPTAPRAALEALLTSGRPEVAPLAGRPRLELRTGAIPSHPQDAPLEGPGWMIVGDTAGQASPLLGEGIRFCLEMGAVAGRAAARRLAADDPGRPTAYPGYWRRKYARKFALEHYLNRRLSDLSPRSWDKAVGLIAALGADAPLDLLAGEFSPRLLLGIAWRHPRLAWQIGRRLARWRGRASG